MRDAFFRAAAGCSLVLVGLCMPVSADPADPPIRAGVQPAPPVRAGEPILQQERDGRRSVRGCSVEERCVRPGDLLREFEIEAFPRPGATPWIDDRSPPASRLEPTPRAIVKRPSELRPDAPWLDQLELPDLPVRWSQTLVDYLVFYRNDPRGRTIMESWLVAQGRYRDMILAHLRKARLPEDLMYVAMIESGYDPYVQSYAGALGLWQFMPDAGRVYGLRQDRWVDERRDPLRATIAQADYFVDLYQRFASWDTALAAFNMGYGGMLRSIARYNTNDFYRLCEYENGIPWETCLYAPKAIAAAIVGRNRALFGFDRLAPAPAETWEEVAIPTSATFAAIARVAGASEADIKRLNPQLRRGRTPPGEAGYVVRVPPGTKAEVQRRIVELESDWAGHDAYVISHGERFEDVATTFGISVAQLRKLNEVTRDGEIEGGTVLVVPRISEDERARNRAKARANLHSSGVDQKPGELLLVPVPDKTAVVAGKRRVFYRVVAGDTLTSVARALAIKPAELAAWNALDPGANLHARMVLLAWVAPDFDAARRSVQLLDDSQLVVVTRGSPEHLDLAEARTGRVRSEYVAQGREKLADVARKFGMGSHDLARINRISYNTVLSKGQTIIVYEVTDPSRSKRADDQWRKTPRARRGKVIGTRAVGSASTGVADDDSDDAGDAADDADASTGDDERAMSSGERTTSPERAKSEPAKPEPARSEPAKSEPARSEPAKSEPARSEPARSEPAKSEPAKPAPAKSEPAKPDARRDLGRESKRSLPQPAAREQNKPRARSAAADPAGDGPVTKPAQVQ
jgi:membrane-bound lytic murein transglycosylase D